MRARKKLILKKIPKYHTHSNVSSELTKNDLGQYLDLLIQTIKINLIAKYFSLVKRKGLYLFVFYQAMYRKAGVFKGSFKALGS